jgi:nitrite reductase/ring-hydroxylating ferredoxin subunit
MTFARTAPSARPHPVIGIDRGEHGVALGPVDELARRKRTVVRVGDIELLVIFHRRRFTVVENRCPHAGAALEDARISGRTLTCSVHRHRYPLGGGSCVGGTHRVGRGGRLRPLATRDVDGCLYADVDAAQRAG